MENADWKTIKSKLTRTLISDTIEFIQSHKDNLPAARMKKVAKIISVHDITYDQMWKRSTIAAQFFTLLSATQSYHEASEQAKLVSE